MVGRWSLSYRRTASGGHTVHARGAVRAAEGAGIRSRAARGDSHGRDEADDRGHGLPFFPFTFAGDDAITFLADDERRRCALNNYSCARPEGTAAGRWGRGGGRGAGGGRGRGAGPGRAARARSTRRRTDGSSRISATTTSTCARDRRSRGGHRDHDERQCRAGVHGELGAVVARFFTNRGLPHDARRPVHWRRLLPRSHPVARRAASLGPRARAAPLPHADRLVVLDHATGVGIARELSSGLALKDASHPHVDAGAEALSTAIRSSSDIHLDIHSAR